MQRDNQNIYEAIYNSDAADLLLKKISQLQQTLRNADSASVKNQKAIDFYTNMLSTMKYAWGHMVQMQEVYRLNAMLSTENDFLKEYARSLRSDLNKYRTIEELKITNEFDHMVKHVDQYMKNICLTPDEHE